MSAVPQTASVLEREDRDGVATLTLNRPQQFNALSDELLDALQAEFDRINADPAVRVVVIRGAGKAFCAGHDLREMRANPSKASMQALFRKCSKVMMSIVAAPQPVIARVHGIATAAGCQLVAQCDLAVAAEDARFAVSGINVGLFCSTPMVALTRAIPAKAAFEMLTTGQFIDAAKAERLGLINRVAAPEALADETRALALSVAGKLASAVRVGKRAFYEQAEMGLDAAYAHTGRVMAENMLHRDTAEGVAAFLEKRKPQWP